MHSLSETEPNCQPVDPADLDKVDGANQVAVVPEFREYRAPSGHGEAFVEPAFSRASELIDANIRMATAYGPLLSDLRGRARRQLIDDAIEYTGVYRDVSWVDSKMTSSIIMAGHQPALFHPGVWFKNFALSHLATKTAALAINLVIDNDVSPSSSIRVPTIDPVTRHAGYASIPYDRAGGGVPYEQTTIQDRTTFDRFDQRVKEAIGPIVGEPCVDQLWVHARAAVERCGVAGCALAQARHGLEDEVGLHTLEVPMGAVCRGSAFAEFALAILTEMPRFRSCYNEAADCYRRANGIRSTAHPVPNLAEDGHWFEAPLWIYGNDAPTRRAAWVRLSNDRLVISDRRSHQIEIDIQHPKLAAEQLAVAVSNNFKLRPRALLTTMYARLILSDLFLHGIGGAKYDQLGDMIMRSFFSVRPPLFMVISATVKLPGIESNDHAERIRSLRRKIRDTRFQGERFADRVELEAGLLRRKRAMLDAIPPRGEKKSWHDEISRINSALAESLGDTRASLRHELAGAERDATAESLLSSREHPFCVFPLDYLRETFDSLLGSSAADDDLSD